MKRVILMMIGLCLAMFLQAQVSKTATVTAGSLSTALTATELSTVTNLTLTGTIDARDFKTMRDNMPTLAVLDLSGVNVVAYTGTEGTGGTNSITYPANTIPVNAFEIPNTYPGKISLTSIVLPSSVTSIGNNTFQYCNGLTSIDLPQLITSIGDLAFFNCTNLTSVTIPSSLISIGIQSISYCNKLTSVAIPSSVTSIGNSAFLGSAGSITVDANNPNYSSLDGILFNKAQTTLIQCLTSKTGSFNIPSTVTSLGTQAFANCSLLTSVAIPFSVSSIGSDAFVGSSGLKTVDINNPNYSSANGAIFNKAQTTLIHCPVSKTGTYAIPSSVTAIGSTAFFSCNGLTSVTIPSSVTTIGDGAFQNCTGLTSINIPSSVTSIGDDAFESCRGLTSINIPSSVTLIGNWTFSGCSGLTSLSIPSSVTTIKSNAFNNCNGLSSITVNWSVPANLSTYQNVFWNVNKTSCALNVPYGTKAQYAAANQWMDFTNIVEMAEFKLSVTSASIVAAGGTASADLTTGLAWTATSDQTWLTLNAASGTGNKSFTFTATANSSFSNRIATVTVSSTGLPSQTIIVTQAGAPKTLAVTAGGLATALTATELNTLTKLILTGTIDARDFKTMRDNMPLLAEIDLSGVNIAAYTGTEGTSVLGSTNYPVDGIPECAFMNNNWQGKISLKLIVFPGTITKMGKFALYECLNLTSANIPQSVKIIEQNVFTRCNKLTNIVIPEGVELIGNQSFYGCSGTYPIFIPESVITIEPVAFLTWVGLINVDDNNPNYSSTVGVLFDKSKTQLIQCPTGKTGSYEIPSTVVTIKTNSFSGCQGLAGISIPSSVKLIENDAFGNCTGLNSITIPSSVKAIQLRAFGYCNNLSSIFINTSTPIDLSSSPDVFVGVNKTTCILNVPFGSKAVYQAASQWKDFANIVEMAEFKLSATTANIAATGGTATSNLTTGLAWSASSDQTWLTVTPVSGNGNQTFTCTAGANASFSNRVAIVSVSATGLPSQTIVITQAGSPKTLNVTAGGLATALTATELSSISKLTLTGTIDARDFKTMRDNMPLLSVVDLSGASIVAYTGTEGTHPYSTSYPANAIPGYAFCRQDANNYLFGKTSLTSIILPLSITSIEDGAFTICTGLTSITLPPLVGSIGHSAFYGCSGLTYMNIPSLVNDIGNQAFEGSSISVTVDAGNLNFLSSEGILFNKSQTILIYCPTSKTGSYSIPSLVITLGSYAFDGCNKLTSITIPSSVTSIGNLSFESCSGLTSITIPSSVTSIGSGTFQFCGGLTSVTIPSSVNSIGSNAFRYCSALASIYSNGASPVNLSSSTDVFYNVNKTSCTLYVPYGTKPLYSTANQWKDFTNIVEMAEFKLSATSATIATTGGTATVNLTTGLTWTAVSDQSWLTVSPASGTGNQTLTYTATANSSYTPRLAMVTVSATDMPSQTIAITQSANNQSLTGIKTINPVGGDFTNFTDAISALNTNGTGTGGVTFMVAAGTIYHEAELTIWTTSSSATNPVIFQKDGNGANPIIYGKKAGGTVADAIVRIFGSDYLTFDGIDISSDPVATMDADKIEIGYSFNANNNLNGCNHIIIKNCKITIDRKANTDNQYGINFYQSASLTEGIHSNILIDNVRFVKGRTSVLVGAGSLPNENIEIRNCKFGELASTIEPLDYTALINLSNCKNISFHNNEIQNIVGPDFYALQTSLTGNNSIFNNKIHNLRSTSTIEDSDLWAIYATSGIGATTNIYNNLIYDLDGAKSSSTLGSNTYWNLQIIQLAGAGICNVYNNTVVGSSVNQHENTIFCWPSATTELRNNIFADFSIAGSNSVRSFFNTVCIVENNLFWMDELLSNNYTYNNISKFREWQKGSSKPSTGNYLTNILANPNFTDRSNFDFSLKNPSPASNNGQAIGFITTDINGVARDTRTPDIGAIEGDFGPAADLIPPLIRFQPIQSNLLDVVKLTAEITDNVKVADAKLWYRDKGSITAFLQIQGSQYGNIWEFTFPALNPGAYEYFVCAKDAVGNVISNGFMVNGLNASLTGLAVNNPPANPDYAYSFANKKTFGGADYTVGTGGNYSSLTRPGGLFDAINSSLVAGNMNITIVSDLDETGEIALKQWQENGVGNYTLTIKPGSATLKTISNSTINPITILGADRVIIDGSYNGDNLNHLKFDCNNANPIKFNNLDTNGCDNISIKYCDFSSISYTCIYAAGTNHSNFIVDHVNAIKGYSGVSLNNVKNASITNCTIGNTDISKPITNYGVYLAGCSNILVENNTIRNIINSTANASALGIYISNIYGGSISRNKIFNVLNSSSSGNCASNGLLGMNCTNMILSNNIISGVNGTGHATLDYNFGIKGIVLTGCNNMKLYYNTVNLYGEGNAATDAESFALSTDNSANLEIRNNIFSNTIYSSNSASFSDLLYQKNTELTNVFTNNLYFNGGTNSNVYAFCIAGNWPDFRGWQSFGFAPGNGRDLSSGYGDPKFTNPGSSDFSLQALSPGLNSGIPVSVNTDFIGNTRNTTKPDMGAIEDNSLALTTDIIAPVIDYTPFPSSINTTPAFSATITDNVAVAAAKLCYRIRGSIDAFVSVDGVKQTDNKTWNFAIISALTPGAGYEYFICAKDAANNIITNGITASVLNTATVGLTNNTPAANPAYFRSFSVADLSITMGTITGSPFFVSDIQSASTEIPFTKNGMFSSGNVITAYLSDANGNFASEKAIANVTSGSENVYEGEYNSVGFRVHPTAGTYTVNTKLPFTSVNANTLHKTQVGDYTGYGLDITVTDQTILVGNQTVYKCNLQITGMPNPADQTVYDTYNGAPMNYYDPATKVFELYYAYNNAAPRKIRETNTMVNLGKLIGVFNSTLPAGTGYKIRVKSSQPAGIVSNFSNAFEIRKIDQTPPIVTLSCNKISPVFSPFTVTIAFNEEVQNFAADKITVSNATVGNLSAVIPNKQFTVLVTPVNTGNVSIQVEANKVVDLAANPNGPSNIISLSYIELDAPYLNITSLSESDTIRTSPSKLKFTFSQDVTGFTAGDIVVANGSISNLVADGTFPYKIYTADLTPVVDGLVKITVADDVASNASSKENSAAELLLSYVKPDVAVITHFTPVWTGNGFDQMNINIYSAKMDGIDLEAGDEVGIFDGTICVGVGTLTGTLSQANTLGIIVSKNNGTGNGYTAGNTISFKLYDTSKTLEMANVTAVYSTENPNWGTDGKFAAGVTSFAALSVVTKVMQDIALNLGWNIISAYVVPANLDLKVIFQSMIDAGSLKKVMDEAGKTIENFGAFGGWKNNIGNLNSTKGYKVNVTAASTLSLEGLPVTLPLNIPLALGWNIISYPCATAQDAKALVQPLIDSGQLKKVMDEAGKTIENFGAFGGWKNNIGNFLPGKGYKVNVTAACTLSVAAPLNKSAVIVPEVLASAHFRKVFTGNGTDHFNVHLVDLASSGLNAGDQIGIFDGKFCVGAATIGLDQLMTGNISIPASCNDEPLSMVNGFTVGHAVTLQLYRENQVYPLAPAKVGGSESFEKNGSLFLKVTASDLPTAKISAGADQVKCYPNPFVDQLTIDIRLAEPKKLEVSIYDLSGKLVRRLFKGDVGTSETLIWDGTNGNGAKMGSGTYILKANEMIEKIALKK